MEATEPDLATRLNRSQGRDRRSRSFGTKFTRLEEGEVYAAAKKAGMYAGEWAREVLLREARREMEDVLLTELVATRMMLVNLIKPLTQGKQMTPEQFAQLTAHVRTEKRKATAELMQQYEETTASGAGER